MTAGRSLERGKINIYLLFILCLILGCEDQRDCVTGNTDQLGINFFAFPEGQNNPQQVRVAFEAVYAKGVDSVFYNATDTVSTMNLPVHPFKSSITYYFESPDFLDSLTLTYKRQARLISPVCGTEQVYKELAIGNTSFDSVAVTEKKLTFDADNNITIYF